MGPAGVYRVQQLGVPYHKASVTLHRAGEIQASQYFLSARLSRLIHTLINTAKSIMKRRICTEPEKNGKETHGEESMKPGIED